MTQDDDHDLLRAWRDEARETPDDLLDHRILKAAQIHRARRGAVPLVAVMAACLVLALYAVRPQPMMAPAPVAELDTSTFGLYEGRSVGLPAGSEGAQQMIHEMPGGSSTATAFAP